jgi:hypothetical protein
MAKRGRGRVPADQPQPREKIPEILAGLASGRSLRSVLTDEGMPDMAAFFRWLKADEGLQTAYAAAMEQRADALFDEMFEIADDATNDWMERTNKRGETYETLNKEAVQRSTLRVDVRKWALARMNPKKYGEKVDLNHGGRVKVVTLDRDDEAI